MEANEKYTEYKALLRERLDDYRYAHSIAVAQRAMELAGIHAADKEKAYTAGLLHDITKNLTDQEQLIFFNSSDIMLTDAEKASSKVWHQISGAYYIENILKIDDKDIINSVRYHTTGRAGMSLLEKIVYLADFTSSDRNYPDVDILREISNKSLNDGMIYALRHTIISLSKKTKPIHPNTISAYNELIIEGSI